MVHILKLSSAKVVWCHFADIMLWELGVSCHSTCYVSIKGDRKTIPDEVFVWLDDSQQPPTDCYETDS